MEVLLNGKFTEQERNELSKELNIQVYEYKTKAVDLGEIVRLVFKDFDAISLLRDGVLFSVLSGLVKKSFITNFIGSLDLLIIFNLLIVFFH